MKVTNNPREPKEITLKLQKLHKTIFLHILILPVLLSLSGCIYLVVGGLGAVGGYVVSPDTVEGVTENEREIVWDAAVEITSIMGTIKEQQEDSGIIIAKVGGAKVTISVIALSQSAVKLRVKSRKAFFPKISTAQDVFVKIMSQVNE